MAAPRDPAIVNPAELAYFIAPTVVGGGLLIQLGRILGRLDAMVIDARETRRLALRTNVTVGQHSVQLARLEVKAGLRPLAPLPIAEEEESA